MASKWFFSIFIAWSRGPIWWIRAVKSAPFYTLCLLNFTVEERSSWLKSLKFMVRWN